MRITIKYNLTDYMALARLVNDTYPGDGREHEVSYPTGDYVLKLTVEDYDGFDVIDSRCYNKNGNEVDTDFCASQLLNILN